MTDDESSVECDNEACAERLARVLDQCDWLARRLADAEILIRLLRDPS